MTPKTCAGCREPMAPRRAAQKGIRQHQARGLCERCYPAVKNAGRLDEFERVTWDGFELIQEWLQLQAQGYTVEQAEARLGLRPKSLQKAIARARQRGLVAA